MDYGRAQRTRYAKGTALRPGVSAVADRQGKNRKEFTLLAEEQAALRRVATLVAHGASSAEMCDAAAREVAQVMHVPLVAITRYDDDGANLTLVAVWSREPHALQPGMRLPLEPGSLSSTVLQTGRPERVDDYTDLEGEIGVATRESGLKRTAGAPIILDDRIWGLMGIASTGAPFPDAVEDRLAEFTELLAAAIANSQAREDLRRLADEQAALRRVATLVARNARPGIVFETVCAEVGRLLPADGVGLGRYEPDGTVSSLGMWTNTDGFVPGGTRVQFDGRTGAGQVFETRRPVRINSFVGVPGPLAAMARAQGWQSSVTAPIFVEDGLWGAVGVASMSDKPLPPDTERRLGQFSELMATAIANAESRAQLAASRARIVATADATRRRIERDLHDGAQQASRHAGTRTACGPGSFAGRAWRAPGELSRAVDRVTSVLDELRDIAQGIHPAILAEGGLEPALKTLGRRSAVPVEFDVRDELRLPEAIEVAAYYVVAEALANTAKYAQASVVHVDVETREGALRVSVRDDGSGGADPAHGSGLVGLKDRAEAIGGALKLHSPRGGGTSLVVELPLDTDRE
jgi:signal transduction histidine kinase